MALENLTPISATYQGWQLLTSQDMHAALEYVVGKGYTGTISAFSDPAGALTWQLVLASVGPQNANAIGAINDWVIIENDTIASICPADHFAARYQIATP